MTGHTTFCHVTACPISCGDPGRSSERYRATSATGLKTSGRIRLCRHVDACHNAVTWWIHHCGGLVQIQHCQDDGDLRFKQGWNKTEDSSSCQYVRCHVCEYVDEQCSCAGVVFLHHSGKTTPTRLLRAGNLTRVAYPPQSSQRLRHDESITPWYRAVFQHRRRRVAHCFATKPHRAPKHAPRAFMGRVVLRRTSRVYHIHSVYLDSPPRNL